MIVKNESKILTRLFDSVINIIDSYCICDTGSTDNSIQIIEDYFLSKKISGKIIIEPFQNFCYNRNVVLQSCVGMSEFVLLLDADMVLKINNFNKSDLLGFDYVSILQGNENFYYQNIRIIKNNGCYKYVGVTHEYIHCPINAIKKVFDKNELFIQDVGDGGSKQNKFERDIQLLTHGIEEDPQNTRYYFYLANSYYDLGKFHEAISFYKKRIEFGGWREEIWYSYYRIGLCYKNMNKYCEANFYWLEAFNYYPERLENIYEIIKYYRINSKHKLCDLYYQIGKQILNKNINRDHYLFLQNDVYTNKLYYEYTIFSSYIGVKNINDEIVCILNSSRDESIIRNLLSNMKFYKDILTQSQQIVLDNSIQVPINNEDTLFMSSSSCLIPKKNNDGYQMNLRYVNYKIDDQGKYHNCKKNIITINKYIEYDNEFNIIQEKVFDYHVVVNCKYIGIEDIRIYKDNNTESLLFIGTHFNEQNKIGICYGKYNTEQNELVPIELNQQFKNTTCEKNWVFTEFNNCSHIIYNWHPLTICKMNENTNLLEIIEKKEMPNIFSLCRGSSCGFIYDSEIWFVTHLVSYSTPRNYYHMIVIFDYSMNLVRYSAPFKFEGLAIEYCLSIIVEYERVLINYSTWDRTTRIGIYNKEYIDSIVKYK
jgi:tetratricopeptide (TPR) repeat protein